MIFLLSRLKILMRFINLLLLFVISFGANAAQKIPDINATAFYLLDANTGRVITNKNENKELGPASITKIMTAYVLFSQIKQQRIKLNDLAYVSDDAAKKSGSKMFVKAGSQVSIENLMRGMIVSSGNDASIAVAEHIAGSEDAFAELMNEYAIKLGMKHTNFVNATGWPDSAHYSSTKDIAILSFALIRDFPELYKIFGEKSFTYGKSPRGKAITQANRNGLLWRKSFKTDGIKTGHTDDAGYCLAASATKDEMRLISVVMGTKSKKARVVESEKLLNFGFQRFRTKKLFNKGQVIQKVKVWKGSESEVNAGSDRDLFATVEKIKINDVTSTIQINEPLIAPISKGQKLGKVVMMVGDEVVVEYPLIALIDVEEGGIFTRLWDSLRFMINW